MHLEGGAVLTQIGACGCAQRHRRKPGRPLSSWAEKHRRGPILCQTPVGPALPLLIAHASHPLLPRCPIAAQADLAGRRPLLQRWGPCHRPPNHHSEDSRTGQASGGRAGFWGSRQACLARQPVGCMACRAGCGCRPPWRSSCCYLGWCRASGTQLCHPPTTQLASTAYRV